MPMANGQRDLLPDRALDGIARGSVQSEVESSRGPLHDRSNDGIDAARNVARGIRRVENADANRPDRIGGLATVIVADERIGCHEFFGAADDDCGRPIIQRQYEF